MTHTIPAENIGQEALGYNILAIPSEATKTRITNLLHELNAELPGVLWVMPPEQMHITLCEVIQVKDYSEDKELLFAAREKEYRDIPRQILSGVLKFTITFDTIEASPGAIIVRASDSSKFNDIRAKLLGVGMQLPDETRTPPDITHSSIARYQSETDLQTIQEVVARHSIEIEEEITEFQLVRTTVPPLQTYEVLETYPLADS